MRRPDFFIIGQARSGTNSLQFQLDQHPDIFISNETKKIFGIEPEVKLEKDYLAQFMNIKQKLIGERNTDYLYWKPSASKIKNFNPKAKIIMILRNPADLIYSLYGAALSRGIDENVSDFKKALDAEEKRKIEQMKNPNKYNPFIFYRDVARYSEQVSRYIELFPRKNILVISFEKFIKNPSEIFIEICNFLEIDSNFKPVVTAKNQLKQVRSNTLRSLVHSAMNSRAQQKILKVPKIQSVYNFVNKTNNPRSEMDPDLKKKLIDEFRPDIDKLSQLLDLDFTYWYKTKVSA